MPTWHDVWSLLTGIVFPKEFGGAGRGCSIARELATLHGGRIHAESTPGVGSRFCLDLPFEAG